jgi:hypothetical protein
MMSRKASVSFPRIVRIRILPHAESVRLQRIAPL